MLQSIANLPCTASGDNPSLEKYKNSYLGICTNPALLANPILKVGCTGPSGILFSGAKSWADKCDIKPTVATAGPAPVSSTPAIPSSPPQPTNPCLTNLKQQRDGWLQFCSNPFVVATKDANYKNNCSAWTKAYEEYLSKCEPNPFPDAANKCPDLSKYKDAYLALCLNPSNLVKANAIVQASCRMPDGQYYRGFKAYENNCMDFIPKEAMDMQCDELYKSVLAKKNMCPAGPADADTVKLACREPDGMWQVLSRAWNKKGCKPPPPPPLPPSPARVAAQAAAAAMPNAAPRTNNENINAYIDWVYYWGDQAVKSNVVSPAYFSSYQSILRMPPPDENISPQGYNNYIDNMANIIYRWYEATDFSKKANLKVLRTNIDVSKPQFKGPAPIAKSVPAAAASAAAVPAAAPTIAGKPQPDSRLNNLLGFTDFKQMYKNIVDSFQDLNIEEGFSNQMLSISSITTSLESIAQNNLNNVQTLLDGSPDFKVLNMVQDELVKNKEKMTKIKDKMERNTKAINRQFTDERAITKVEKAPKVMVLQDYILAAFTIAFAFFAVVAIFYVVKQNEYSGKSFLLMTALMTIVSAILASWVLYMA